MRTELKPEQQAKNTDKQVDLQQVNIDGEDYFMISNCEEMRPFFMSIVSDSNHWMFIGSNGGLSAGRKNSEFSLFPYYTDDKIIESAEITGSKSIFLAKKDGKDHVWEPFSIRYASHYHISRNLYKNVYGNKIMFEEVNHDLKLSFRYQWNSSNGYGFVKKSKLANFGEQEIDITLLDGLQNILPLGVGSALQNAQSNLVDAYKRSELDKESGLGVFALSAIIVDKAEPSEALKANVAWSCGLNNPKYLLSSFQLDRFRHGTPLEQEEDVKAEKGAYFVYEQTALLPGQTKDWMIVANVNQNMAGITQLTEAIKNDDRIADKVNEDIELGTERLIGLTAASDGLQLSQDKFRDTRHFSNTLFNIMRGGIFDSNYEIEKTDFTEYIAQANKEVARSCAEVIDQLPEVFSLAKLKEISTATDSKAFRRLCLEYLPLKFSRRHGDPSRPWNRFSINTHDENGAKILDYEGNWRDIFQNWEALAHSYPEFIEGMIFRFLNASTFDGYNPYRITKNGIDWEKIEPDDPWSYIGYWGDHQIIYLLKFLEFAEDRFPGHLESYFNEELFVYANVPYRIKPYDQLLINPKDTIDFDQAVDDAIGGQSAAIGADSVLLKDNSGAVVQVNFVEKILATVLAKMSNFIPEGGIWMNTQRPEWNDANNALVGNGVSMVTLYYLTRFLKFSNRLFSNVNTSSIAVSSELKSFFDQVNSTLEAHKGLLSGSINDQDRKHVLDGLGQAASDYRHHIYDQSFNGSKQTLTIEELIQFTELSISYLDHSLQANKRPDGLYHAYNLMSVVGDDQVSISYLDEMLEGQVAVLSSGNLPSEEALAVLDALKSSALFRPDQYSYILYPNKQLPSFFERNNIPTSAVENSRLLKKLVEDGDIQIIQKDINGVYHFNGNFKNANDLKAELACHASGQYAQLVEEGQDHVLELFEQVFNHKAFTGRSGTFYGYEGLGSIYWHMVSKLLLAVQECCLRAIKEQASDEVIGRLLEHYYEINEGIGVHKPPTLYGAFPTDPYSHTPASKGAQQPGMTGQVKEDILCRFGELGVEVNGGKLTFNPCMLRKGEFLKEAQAFEYLSVACDRKQISVEPNELCFTYCQVPITYRCSNEDKLEVTFQHGESSTIEGLVLDNETSSKIFKRSGEVNRIVAYINEGMLK
ncbi:MAG: hypothetical protein AAFX87_12220 [Bacteroidota bacterium]